MYGHFYNSSSSSQWQLSLKVNITKKKNKKVNITKEDQVGITTKEDDVNIITKKDKSMGLKKGKPIWVQAVNQTAFWIYT